MKVPSKAKEERAVGRILRFFGFLTIFDLFDEFYFFDILFCAR
jgi:hypothetical protein